MDRALIWFLALWVVGVAGTVSFEDLKVSSECSTIVKPTDHLLFTYQVTFANGTIGPYIPDNIQPFYTLLDQGEEGSLKAAMKGMCENSTRRMIVDTPKDCDLEPIFPKHGSGGEQAVASMEESIWIDIMLKKVTDQENYKIFDAFKQHNYSLVIDLIDAHTGVNSMDEYGQTPLMIAVSQQILPVVASLLNTRLPKVDVNMAKANGFNALFYAVERATPSILEALLRRGADPNSAVKQDGGKGNTPLHYACMLEKVKHAGILLEYGARPDSVNEFGQVPLQLVPKDAVRSTKLMYKQMFNEVYEKMAKGIEDAKSVKGEAEL